VLVVPAGNASAWTGPTGNNTYLLPAGLPALVDAGVGLPVHLDAVARALDGRPLALLLITHGHPDHVGGVPAIRARWPAVTVMAGRDLADGQSIAAGGATLRALHTPGHAPDHFCFLDEASGGLFCGDMLRRGGTVVIPASQGGDLAAYLASLRRIRELRPARLLPGHGPIVDDPVALVDEYVRHRLEREEQIVEALRQGAATPAEIVPRVYGTLASGIVRAAADSVLAHLIKLGNEGRVQEADGRWILVPVP
jgi:glyoxylase-like metal-dependent hydrolase (beta-lactamase superfamily II)